MVLRGPLTIVLFLLAGLWGAIASAQNATPQHALVQFGTPKYRSDFTSFDYVNPAAPKGGLLRQLATGTFDTLNPFILKKKWSSLSIYPWVHPLAKLHLST